jgi:hypothetical protein
MQHPTFRRSLAFRQATGLRLSAGPFVPLMACLPSLHFALQPLEG